MAMLCLPMWLFAQADTTRLVPGRCAVKLAGHVIDGETKAPLEGAQLSISGSARVSFSNADGRFEIKGICGNRYEVTCSRVGYKQASIVLDLSHNATWDFILHSDECEMESVVIVGQKQEEQPTQSKLELSGRALDNVRGLSLGESLQQLPGVSALQTGPTVFKPVVQGMYGQRVLILNNGIRQEGQQWGSEHAPEIDPFVAGRLSVVKGASSVRYGSDAIGGVILVDPLPLRKEAGIGGSVHVGGFSNNRAVAGSALIDYSPKEVPGLSARIQGTYRKGGNARTPDYYLKNTGMEEYNFSYALGYFKRRAGVEVFYSQFNTKLGVFSASHIGNLTDLKRAMASPVPLETAGFTYDIGRPYQQVAHELFKTSAYVKSRGGSKWSASYALQYNDRREYDRHRSNSDSLTGVATPSLELHITTHTANLLFEHRTVKNFKGTIGVNGIVQGNIYKGRLFIPNFKSYAAGVYWLEQWSKDRWQAEIGVRYDYKWMQAFFYEGGVYRNPEYNFSNLSGSLGATYHVSEHLKLRSNLGSAFRPPHVSELFSNGLHHGSASIEYGNEGLRSERAYNLSLSAHWQYKRTAGEINAYYTYVDNYIYLAPVFPATLTIRGAFPTFRYTQVDATFAGIDAWVSDSLSKHFVVTSKASLIYAYNNTVKDYLILTPPTRLENGIVYNLYKNNGKIKPYVGLTNTIVFRKALLPDSVDYAPAPRGYTLFSAQAGLSWKVGKQTLDINLTCNNMLNQRYRDYLDRFRYYADGIGRNFIIRVKWTF
jgi:iron complex outermembrane receptor protein